MEELKTLGGTTRPNRVPAQALPSVALDHKISAMDVLLKQMVPSDYDYRNKEDREKAFQDLKKLVEYKREGLLNETEFFSLKKMLLQSFKD